MCWMNESFLVVKTGTLDVMLAFRLNKIKLTSRSDDISRWNFAYLFEVISNI